MNAKGIYKRIVVWIVPALILVVGILLLGRCSKQQEAANTYIWKEEIPDWLKFTGFSAEDIESRIGESGRVSRKDVDTLVAMLHLSDEIEVNAQGRYLTRAEWVVLYRKFLDYYEANQVQEKDVILLETNEEIWTTAEGDFYCEEVSFLVEPFYAYTVFFEGDYILGVAGKVESETVLENEYIVECANEKLIFMCDNTEYQVEVDSEQTISGVVADLVFLDGKITCIRKKEDQIQGKLLALTDTYAEIKGYGQVPCSEKMKFYSTYDGIRESKKEELLLENMEITYVVAEGEICAFLMKEAAALENIRVLILNGESPYYENIYINGDGPVKISIGDNVNQVEGGALVTASDYQEKLAEDTVFLTSADGSFPLYLTDASGARISNGYCGTLELRHYEAGYTVVNVLPLETYIKGVISSEMPATYELEALKCQAVCARSYAYRQLLENHYPELGAHVDDSTNYQVYNKSAPSPVTDQAVDETVGQVLCWGDQVIEAFYYSTSYGHSGDYTAWNLDAAEYPYLSGYWLRQSEGTVDLSNETAFSEYIRQPDSECYESDIKFFRWTADLNFTERKDALCTRIRDRKSLQPEMIHYYKKSDGEETDSLEHFGELIGISIAGRDSSGVIERLDLLFEKGTVSISSEYNMRYILASGLSRVIWQDGSTTDSAGLIPSSYFTIAENGNGSYTLCGGGYGHGLGMSQNGAQRLAQNGWKMEDILKKFYPDTGICNLYCLADEFVVE